MSSAQALTARQQDILFSIVESYIETGEPVASRTISKMRKNSLSPASIRNVMADLDEDGYLEQPHTSAGRIPTEKAFRLYAESLRLKIRPLLDPDRVRLQLNEAASLSDRIERSSRLLSQITRNIGIAAAIPTASQTLEHIELIRLSPHRALMVVVTRDRMVRDRVVFLEDDIGADELVSIRNYLNENFSGWILSEARQELRRRLEQERAAYDEILKRLAVLYGKGLLEPDLVPAIHMEGTSNLVGLDFHLTREKLRDLFRALEQKERMLQLLDRFLEQRSSELGVQVGLGDLDPAMRPLSLIGLNISLPGGLSARIAVLGPMRMNYQRVIAAVLEVGGAFQEAID
jgi:heat-inducible transcriptional repressor